MTKPYPMELRERAVRFVTAGESRNAVAKRPGVSVSCVVKWLARYRDTGSVRPAKTGGHVPLQGLADELAIRGMKVDYRTKWNFVHREGLSFKKSGTWG
jgi:putative transposase